MIIFVVKNITNDRHFLGFTKDMERAKSFHLDNLARGTHPSELMQRDYDSERGYINPRDKFSFIAIDSCPKGKQFNKRMESWEMQLAPDYNG